MRHSFEETRQAWPLMSGYERFEQVIVLILTLLIAVVIVVAIYQLILEVAVLVGSFSGQIDHGVFQTVFGVVMTVLIALEFNHSILSMVERGKHIIQVRTVLLIAMLALARKFIILDLKVTPATGIAALALALLALGIVYWLIRQDGATARRLATWRRSQGTAANPRSTPSLAEESRRNLTNHREG